MKLIVSILIGILFIYFKYLEEKGLLDSINFRLLGLQQLPEVNLDFIGIIIKKLLIAPQYVFDYINLFLAEINNGKIYFTNIYLNIFIFYFLFSFIILEISSFFYRKDALIVKFFFILLILVGVYFI